MVIAFGLKPSILDARSMFGLGQVIPDAWESSFSGTEIGEENGFYIARSDTIYDMPGGFSFLGKDDIVPLYESIRSLGSIKDVNKEDN